VLSTRVEVHVDRSVRFRDYYTPSARRVATAKPIAANLVDVIAAVAILTGKFFEPIYAIDELAEVRPYGNSVDLVHHFTDKTTMVDCNG
jgi:hypothetical protein